MHASSFCFHSHSGMLRLWSKAKGNNSLRIEFQLHANIMSLAWWWIFTNDESFLSKWSPCLSKPMIFWGNPWQGPTIFDLPIPLLVPTYHCCHLPAQSFVQCLQAAFEPEVSGTGNVKTEGIELQRNGCICIYDLYPNRYTYIYIFTSFYAYTCMYIWGLF